MATITVRDLQENTELDRQAMQAIAGGARFRASAGVLRPVVRKVRLYDPAPGRSEACQSKARPPLR
jgi:hypothetical protein